MTKKDFEVQWFSGTGKGGQHRNKHQNCCRIVHKESGLSATGTGSRERSANQKEAFKRLAAKLIALYQEDTPRRFNNEIVRTYHFEDDRVIDHSTGIKRNVGSVLDGDLDDFITDLNREGERPKSGRV